MSDDEKQARAISSTAVSLTTCSFVAAIATSNWWIWTGDWRPFATSISFFVLTFAVAVGAGIWIREFE